MSPSAKWCSAYGCDEHRHSQSRPDVRVHHFPQDVERCREWVRRSGNRDLLKYDVRQLSTLRFLCTKHFKKEDYRNSMMKSLQPNAVPSVFKHPYLSEHDVASIPAHRLKRQREPEDAFLLDDEEADEPAPKVSIMEVAQPSQPRRSVEREEWLPGSSPRPRDAAPVRRITKQVLASELGFSYASLSPESKKILQCAQDYKDEARRIRRRLQHSQSKRRDLKALSRMKFVDRVEEMLISPVARLILKAELKNFKRVPRARRWTAQDKAWALGIFKRSPRVYRWMASLLTMPDKKTLKNTVHRVTLQPGIDSRYFNSLADQVSKLHKLDKFCSITFDEVAIAGGVSVHSHNKLIYVDGFEDFGPFGRTGAIADHALVFQLQGLRKKWKQPLAYFFCKGTTPSLILSKLIKVVIESSQKVGFKVLASVSDQGSTNRAAINILRKSCEEGEYENVYQVNGAKIVHFYDVPHLLKSVRNHFIKSNVLFNGNLCAKWEHVISLKKNLDKDLIKLVDLTCDHVQPTGRKKMSVKLAAQVLSAKVALAMQTLFKLSEGKKMEENLPTSLFISYIDFLFDLSNGPGPFDKKKPTRCNVSETSPHHALWREMKKFLEELKFIRLRGKNKGKKYVPPCIKGWIENLKGFQRLWSTVKKHGFRYLNLRQLNQDALENLFSIIRQTNGCNSNPTVSQFKSGITTVILNKCSSGKIRGKNCSDDESLLLYDLRELLSKKQQQDADLPNAECSLQRGDQTDIPELKSSLGQDKSKRQGPAYVCGSIARSILKCKDFNCRLCKSCLTTEEISSDHTFTSLKEYPDIERLIKFTSQKNRGKNVSIFNMFFNVAAAGSNRHLTYASLVFINTFLSCERQFLTKCVKNIADNNIHEMTKSVVESQFPSDWLCPIHSSKLKDVLVHKISLFLLKTVCKRINRNLKDKARRKMLHYAVIKPVRSRTVNTVVASSNDLVDEWESEDEDSNLLELEIEQAESGDDTPSVPSLNHSEPAPATPRPRAMILYEAMMGASIPVTPPSVSAAASCSRKYPLTPVSSTPRKSPVTPKPSTSKMSPASVILPIPVNTSRGIISTPNRIPNVISISIPVQTPRPNNFVSIPLQQTPRLVPLQQTPEQTPQSVAPQQTHVPAQTPARFKPDVATIVSQNRAHELTCDQLRAYLKSKGAKGLTRMRKDALVKLCAEWRE